MSSPHRLAARVVGLDQYGIGECAFCILHSDDPAIDRSAPCLAATYEVAVAATCFVIWDTLIHLADEVRVFIRAAGKPSF